MNDATDPSRGGLGGFFAELKRRHVVRAGVAYAAVAFVVLQAAEIIQQAFSFPDWVLRLVVVFTLLAFPVVLAFAWVYEITPLGLRTTREIDAEIGLPESGGLPRVAFLVVTLIVVGVSGWWWVRTNVGEVAAGTAPSGGAIPAALTRSAGDPIRSVVVLPFESFTQERGRDYFAEGMHEALISQLSQLDFLRVLSRTSASEFDKSGKTVPQIGAELGVDALIEGSVLRADGRVRITVQLIDAATDFHLWTREYERDLVDIIALQREVASAIVQELRGELSPDAAGAAQTTAATLPAGPTDPEASEAVMRGRMALADLSGGGSFTPTALDSVAQHFQHAIERDPTFAAAYRGLAQVYLMRALSEGADAATGAAASDIRAAAETARQAMELDPESRETQEVLASVGLLGATNMPELGVGGPFMPDVRLGTDSMGVVMVGDVARPMVSLTEPGRQIQIAVAHREAGSEAPSRQLRAARRFFSVGLPAEARQVLEGLVREDPRNLQAWDDLEQIHRVMGDLDAVVDLWRARSRIPAPPGAPQGPPVSIEALERAVQQDSARGYWSWRLSELEARERRGAPVSAVEMAAAHAGLGNRDRALSLLAEGAREGDPRLRSVRTDPVWDPFRRDPRFSRALEEANDRYGPPSSGGRGGGGGRSQGRSPDSDGRGGAPRPPDGGR